MPATLADNRYGKSRVRLLRVTRHEQHRDREAHHDVAEWTVQILLTGDFTAAHLHGDNTGLLATDTMKNTVYFVARQSPAASMEDYARDLIDFLLTRNPQVASAEVMIASALWKRLTIDGQPHPTAFMRGSDERQTCTVIRAQNAPFTITSGLDRLTLMKTAQSGFVGFLRDSLTTLPETTDRLFATALEASWPYTASAIAAGIDFDKVRSHIRETLVTTFAKHDSLSVQQTMFAMGEAALAYTDIFDSIHMVMPNKHNLLVDLARFGETNPNHIFVPTDDPHGTIEATIRRA